MRVHGKSKKTLNRMHQDIQEKNQTEMECETEPF